MGKQKYPPFEVGTKVKIIRQKGGIPEKTQGVIGTIRQMELCGDGRLIGIDSKDFVTPRKKRGVDGLWWFIDQDIKRLSNWTSEMDKYDKAILYYCEKADRPVTTDEIAAATSIKPEVIDMKIAVLIAKGYLEQKPSQRVKWRAWE